MPRLTALFLTLLVALTGCRAEPVEPLLERLDRAGVPAAWTLVDTEIRDDCSPLAGERCPGVERTWHTDQPEREVFDTLIGLFPGAVPDRVADVAMSDDRCDHRSNDDCYAVLLLASGEVAAQVKALWVNGRTEVTILLFHD